MERIKNSISFYNRIARVYNLCLDWVFTPGRKKTANILNQKNNLSILEIGSGTGSLIKNLENNHSYTGIDGSKKMIQIAKQKYPSTNFQNINYEDFETNQQFDAIVIHYTLSVVQDPEYLLIKASEWLKPNGKIYIVNHFSSPSTFYKILQYFSIHFGYNAYFPFDEKLFSTHYKITTFESVNLFGGWKFIVLEHNS